MRLVLVPVFATYAVAYGASIVAGEPEERYRWLAIALFTIAAVSDGVDGWVARRFNQKSDLGAFLDPIADKFLLLVAVVTLALIDWGEDGWRLPLWYAVLVFVRDAFILIGLGWLYTKNRNIQIRPHWVSKWCTVTQIVAIGWVMLRIVPASPAWPCLVAGALTLRSAWIYGREGMAILRSGTERPPG